jgi:membrane protein YdbS with pleckstrin-like domain
MKQAIAGVTPLSEREVTVMTVWPSVAAMQLLALPVGRWLGKAYGCKAGAYIFTLGNLCCLLAIPAALVLYAKRIGPFVATRYRVTNQRIVVERGLSSKEERSIGLDKFDKIDVQVQPGQEWYDAGDLIFSHAGVERFRLEGVSRPQAFRSVCWKSHQAFTGVRKAMERETVSV